jgi:hypothetical protein
MLSIGLWRWYINITFTILDIIHRPVLYLKHNVSETGFYLRLQVEPTQLGPMDTISLLFADSETICIDWYHITTACVTSFNYSLTQREGTWEDEIYAVGRRLTRKRENPIWACAWHIPTSAITHRKILYMYCIRRIIFSKHNANISTAAISMLLLWIISLKLIPYIKIILPVIYLQLTASVI